MIDRKSIENAHKRIDPYIHNTPVFTNAYFNDLIGAKVYFKCENFQKTGSFKARGALNSVLQFKEKKKRKGVCTHSSGNHGQALAWAAKKADVAACIVMPKNAPQVKVNAVREYGAEVIFCENTLEARESTLAKVMDERGSIFIPPYDAENTIIGQASCALEIFEEFKNLDYLLTPVGGGGLLSGSALSGKYFSPHTKVVGCEPELACDAYESFYTKELKPAKEPVTIADGLRTSLGKINFKYIRQNVEDILLCSEDEIAKAQQMIWQRMKLVIEPSSAVPVACLLRYRAHFHKKEIAIIISGGNVDFVN